MRFCFETVTIPTALDNAVDEWRGRCLSYIPETIWIELKKHAIGISEHKYVWKVQTLQLLRALRHDVVLDGLAFPATDRKGVENFLFSHILPEIMGPKWLVAIREWQQNHSPSLRSLR
jgi:hypothetical protein